MANRIARRALSIGLHTSVAKATDAVSAFGGIEDWLKKALEISGACDHKDWLIAQADAQIDKVIASKPLPAWMKRIAAREAKRQVRKLVNKVCPVA